MTNARSRHRGTPEAAPPRRRSRTAPDERVAPTESPTPADRAATAGRAATADRAAAGSRRAVADDRVAPDGIPPPAHGAPGSTDRPGPAPLAGRRAQAARNDAVILAAARDVFLDDPKAPVAAVAERAGVGMSALYRRYPGKEDLLRQLCHDGLRRFNAEAESAAAEPDGWAALTTFLRAVVDADVHSLTVHLAGTFTSTPEMRADAQRSGVLVAELVRRAHESGTLRPDVVAEDVGLLLEGCASIRVPDPERTKQLRRRHLRLLLDGLSAGQAGRAGREDTLPGPPPAADELNWRWRRPPAS
ncbi:TetR/AcrR family transcriptional regulator [Virgisporangium ochraceum]|uniref:HTH tetR-type domain-containing protein n=1 Tax=Virgisporangium ochraceum TaxID=65505 RepID=A0A8J3ZVY6_9ACTN|nr:TetR/AcrR family transcriptional regulator [Virgisporangium ochraceum]GIJ71132.1 hypothetical protein Voc01_060490 [Virgisporangium ochraceum]